MTRTNSANRTLPNNALIYTLTGVFSSKVGCPMNDPLSDVSTRVTVLMCRAASTGYVHSHAWVPSKLTDQSECICVTPSF